ncbi:MAG: hypothetical protein J6328_00350 [Bacilli bacterium]|nr:hypothetical protein [Bacilli bacterium]
MNWHFLYLAKENIDIKELAAYFLDLGVNVISTHFTSVKEGEIVGDDSLVLPFFSFAAKKRKEGNEITVVISHASDGWSEMMLHQVAPKYYPGQVSFMSDLVLKQMSFGDFSAFSFLSPIFRDVSDELLKTCRAY